MYRVLSALAVLAMWATVASAADTKAKDPLDRARALYNKVQESGNGSVLPSLGCTGSCQRSPYWRCGPLWLQPRIPKPKTRSTELAPCTTSASSRQRWLLRTRFGGFHSKP